MKITRIYIDGFGIINNLDIRIPDDKLVIFYGENESGKTTLMEFIKFVLVGPKRKERMQDVWYEPLRGGKFGGYLEVIDSKGQEYIVERYITSKSKAEGDLIVKNKDTLVEAEKIDSIVGNISRQFYTSIFAYGLSDLSDLASLDKEEVKAKALASVVGISPDALNKAYTVLKSQMDSIYKPTGTKPEVNMLLLEIEELEGKIQEAKSKFREYDSLRYKKEEFLGKLNHGTNQYEKINSSLLKLEASIDEVNEILYRKAQSTGETKSSGIMLYISSILFCTTWVLFGFGLLKLLVAIGFSSVPLALLIATFLGNQRRKRIEVEEKRIVDRAISNALSIASEIDKSVFGNFDDIDGFDIEYAKKVVEQLKAARLDIDKDLSDINRYLSDYEAQIKIASKDDDIKILTQRAQSMNEKLKEKLKSWLAASVCQSILKKSQDAQEEKVWPELMNDISKYSAKITNSKYEKVLISELGNFTDVLAVNKRGTDIDSKRLSSGTRDQIYLAIRLALAEQYSRKIEALPLLMDDIMVNYDLDRLASSVEMINELSDSQQIFIFTCHKHILESFRLADKPYMVFDMKN